MAKNKGSKKQNTKQQKQQQQQQSKKRKIEEVDDVVEEEEQQEQTEPSVTEETTTKEETKTTTHNKKNKQQNKKAKKDNETKKTTDDANDEKVAAAAADEDDAVVDKTTLLLYNLSPQTPKDVIQSCMSEIAEVKKIILIKLKSRLSALVQFNQPVGDEALEYNGAEIDDSKISLRFATSNEKKVFVTNVSTTVTASVLRTYMEEIGQVASINEITDKEGTIQKTFLIEFKDYQHAIDSLTWNGSEIRGRPVKFFLYHERK